jgi:hypothetical protein
LVPATEEGVSVHAAAIIGRPGSVNSILFAAHVTDRLVLLVLRVNKVTRNVEVITVVGQVDTEVFSNTFV